MPSVRNVPAVYSVAHEHHHTFLSRHVRIIAKPIRPPLLYRHKTERSSLLSGCPKTYYAAIFILVQRTHARTLAGTFSGCSNPVGHIADGMGLPHVHEAAMIPAYFCIDMSWSVIRHSTGLISLEGQHEFVLALFPTWQILVINKKKLSFESSFDGVSFESHNKTFQPPFQLKKNRCAFSLLNQTAEYPAIHCNSRVPPHSLAEALVS